MYRRDFCRWDYGFSRFENMSSNGGHVISIEIHIENFADSENRPQFFLICDKNDVECASDWVSEVDSGCDDGHLSWRHHLYTTKMTKTVNLSVPIGMSDALLTLNWSNVYRNSDI